ncbi:MAG: cytidylate kinase [Deltaproteobacteria bacterium HGW-Deltaproteobacteria-23]|nr:MAG: cytidylate kinase [Deltaproteobacteria bacterium HGW-Deltaproteobacteria-23]
MNCAASSAKKRLIVAIDGPSGAGKSSVTKALADRIGYLHIDTGAMFRVVALFALRSGINIDDHIALAAICAGLNIDFALKDGVCRVFANGEDVSTAIRSPEISLLTSKVAAVPAVRNHLLLQQRRMGERGGVVLEGRDIGTVVFPEADVKFYLTASAEERGRRRFAELSAKGVTVNLQQTVTEVMQRDEQDMNRQYAPLRRAEDAIEIDSTNISLEKVMVLMEESIHRKETGDRS